MRPRRRSRHLQILVILILISVASALASWGLRLSWDVGGLLLNLATELVGALVTYVLLQRVVARRAEHDQAQETAQQRREAEKARLIQQMGSMAEDVAVTAAKELRRRGWLADGSLRWADLWRANLRGAELGEADLQETWLGEANLQGAALTAANLQGAHLWAADLQRAKLVRANLLGSDLRYANLQGADLASANLQWAWLGLTRFDENTVLPDGTRWSPHADMARFTDLKHPQFWHAIDPGSPAYRGDV